MQVENLKIKATPLSDEVCSFQFMPAIFNDIDAYCDSKQKAQGSKLLEQLFMLEGVKEVLIRNGELKLKKLSTDPWPPLAKQVGATIRELIKNNQELIAPSMAKSKPNPIAANQTQELTPKQQAELEQVQAVMEQQVLPALAQHGGSATIERYADGVLYLRFSGGCQGCAQVNATVKGGIENMLKQRFDFIQKVEDITEHEAGENPYF